MIDKTREIALKILYKIDKENAYSNIALNEEIKEKLKELKKLGKEKSVTTENVQQLVEELKKKRNKIILHLYKNVYRLKRAFPTINTSEITEILNQKIELRKKLIKKKQKGLK